VKFSEYTEKKKPVTFPYTLHDTTLRTTEHAKYIGVTISRPSNLNWSSHINTITNKAKTVCDSSDEKSKHKTNN